VSRFKAVFLDMGGTVLEVHGVAEPYLEILIQHGYRATLEQVRGWLAAARQPGLDSTRGEPSNAFRVDWAGAAGRHTARVEAFLDLAGVGADLDACRAAMVDSWVGSRVFGLYPEAPAVLAELKGAGLIIGAVSNWEPRLPQLCANLGIARYFDFILASEAEGWAKPAARLFEIALERAGVTASEALHAGDHPTEDVQAAESAGISAVLIDRSEERARTHSPRIPSLEALLPLALAEDWLQGRVLAGRGEAAGFMRLPWLLEQVAEKLGFLPYPGTLNLRIERREALTALARLRERAAIAIEPAAGFCAARSYPVSVEGRVPGAILLPDVPGYPDAVVEVIAPVALRGALCLRDGAEVTLALGALSFQRSLPG